MVDFPNWRKWQDSNTHKDTASIVINREWLESDAFTIFEQMFMRW